MRSEMSVGTCLIRSAASPIRSATPDDPLKRSAAEVLNGAATERRSHAFYRSTSPGNPRLLWSSATFEGIVFWRYSQAGRKFLCGRWPVTDVRARPAAKLGVRAGAVAQVDRDQ